MPVQLKSRITFRARSSSIFSENCIAEITSCVRRAHTNNPEQTHFLQPVCPLVAVCTCAWHYIRTPHEVRRARWEGVKVPRTCRGSYQGSTAYKVAATVERRNGTSARKLIPLKDQFGFDLPQATATSCVQKVCRFDYSIDFIPGLCCVVCSLFSCRRRLQVIAEPA